MPEGAILGGILGALLGSEVGRQMDALDERQMSRSFETARTYEEVRWVNPDTGGAYAVTPVRTYERPTGAPCREFRMRANVGGREEEVYGTACREADGSWRVVDTNGAR
jgi:surface antigen